MSVADVCQAPVMLVAVIVQVSTHCNGYCLPSQKLPMQHPVLLIAYGNLGMDAFNRLLCFLFS
jgi:hypothetical protein